MIQAHLFLFLGPCSPSNQIFWYLECLGVVQFMAPPSVWKQFQYLLILLQELLYCTINCNSLSNQCLSPINTFGTKGSHP